MDLARDGNIIEAGVWAMCAIAVLIQTRREPPAVRGTLVFLAITLAVFGVSDLVESRTGAWWKPWWLFVWKALCVLSITALLWNYFKVRKQMRESAKEEKL